MLIGGSTTGGAGGSECDCAATTEMAEETAEEELTAVEGIRLEWDT